MQYPMMVPHLPLLLLLWPTASVLAQSPSALLSGSSSVSQSSVASSVSTATNATSGSLTASPTSSTAFPSLSGLSSCVDNCLALSIAEVGCDSIVEVNCFCNNATLFTETLVACINPTCPGDLGSAESVSEQFCGLASSSVSLSFSSLPTTNSLNASSASSAPSLTSSSSPSLISSSSSSSIPPATPTTTVSSVASSTSAASSPTGGANQSSGASVSHNKAPRLWITFAMGMCLVLFEVILRW